MRRTLIVATCFVLAGLAAQAARAEMINGQYVPHSLVGHVGTQYRLVVVTSGSIKADANDPTVYDNFLAGQMVGTMLGDYDYGWKAVVSTEGGARFAKDIVSDAHYGVDSSMPYAGVYNTAGINVATSGDAMLAPNLPMLSAVLYDQHGTSVYDGYAWTGSFANGEPALSIPPGTLGNSTKNAMLGATGANDGTWLALGTIYHGGPIPFVARIYGMSEVLEVPAVPEPSTVVLWSLFTGAAGLVFWRKRRRSN
jgi:hypothetical protein